MPLKPSFKNRLCFATGVLYLTTIARGTESVPAPQSLAPSISFGLLSQSPQSSAPVSASRPIQSGVTTLITLLTSTTTVTSTIRPSQSQPRDALSSSGADPGAQYGNVIINNHCNESFYIQSVGAFHLGGYRDDAKGWGVPAEDPIYTLNSGNSYTVPYRMSCPTPANHTRRPVYCPEQDKLQVQGVSLKISRSSVDFSVINQIEYALIQNPRRNDTFDRLEYDVSLLDCANPVKRPEAFSAQGADGYRDVAKITDFNATAADHKAKVEMCTGYRDGVSVTFPKNSSPENYQSIRCNGHALCLGIYNFDRTRQDESSLSCKQEYEGDMVVDLCLGRMNATVKAL